MSHWVKLSKWCYVGKVGPTTYWVKRPGSKIGRKRVGPCAWHIEDDCGGVWGEFGSAREAMLAVEEMPGTLASLQGQSGGERL